MGNRHIKIISALRFLLPFAQAECSPLEVCLKGTFKTQSQTFVWLFFLAFCQAASFCQKYRNEKGASRPLRYSILFCLAQAGTEALDARAGFFEKRV